MRGRGWGRKEPYIHASCTCTDLMIAITVQQQYLLIHNVTVEFHRFGSFEILKTRDPQTGRAGPSVGRTEVLEQLIDYTTDNFFKEVYTTYCTYAECSVRPIGISGYFMHSTVNELLHSVPFFFMHALLQPRSQAELTQKITLRIANYRPGIDCIWAWLGTGNKSSDFIDDFLGLFCRQGQRWS